MPLASSAMGVALEILPPAKPAHDEMVSDVLGHDLQSDQSVSRPRAESKVRGLSAE